MGHAQQIKRFSHALCVLLSFKQMKRFLMCLESLLRSSYIHQPVAEAIKAACPQRRISKILGQITGTAEPSSCLFVITSGPEKTKHHHTLPFPPTIMSSVGCL